MYHLSENQIKEVALTFIKGFYKDRPRKGNTTSGFDKSADGNIVIDGYLSFMQEDGENFLATFEATSIDKQKEVVYKFQKLKLFIASFAISSFLVLICLSFYISFRAYSITSVNWIYTLWTIGYAFLVFFFVSMLFLFRSHRYRYIYAVEQFKRYHADDQWIVVADDVFIHPDEKNLKELKRQCIQFGFGLFSVNQNMEGQLMITPSRNEMFANQRKGIASLDTGILSKVGGKQIAPFFTRATTSFKKVFNRKKKSKSITASSTRRFQQRSYFPPLSAILSTLAIAGIFYLHLRDDSKEFVNEFSYRSNLENAKESSQPTDYLIDTIPMERYPFSAGLLGYLSDIEYSNDAEIIDPGFFTASSDNIKFFFSTESGAYYTYDCERLFHFKGTNYLLQDNVFKLWDNAFNRIQFLKEKGIFAHAIQTGCFKDNESEYIVFYEIIFDEKIEAEETFPEYISELKAQDIITANTQIRELQF